MQSIAPRLRYLWQTYRALPGNRKQKEKIISQVEDSLRSFADARPNADYKALVARFGTPKQIAASYVEEMDTPELMENMKASKRVVCIVLAAALIALAMWAGVVGKELAEHYNYHDSYYTEEIIYIEDVQNETGG